MGFEFAKASCCESGINPEAVYNFITRAENENLGIDSFILLKAGKVVAEGCHAPYTMTSPHVLYSMSKSITSLALGYAICEGKVSLDDSIANTSASTTGTAKTKKSPCVTLLQ